MWEFCAHATTKKSSGRLAPSAMSACPSRPYLLCFVLFLISFSIPLVAQEREKEPGKGKAGGSDNRMVKVDGTLHCDKPNPDYAIEVSDRPGHALTISQRRCTWTKPLVVAGAKTKEGVTVDFAERMEGGLHVHGYDVETLDSGDKLTWRTMGQVLGEKGPATSKGRWSFMKGTGKFKGITGGGTYEGKLEADDSLTLTLEGVYLPAEMPGGIKKNEEKK